MQRQDAIRSKVVSTDGPKEDEMLHEVLLRKWTDTTIEPEEESQRRRSVLKRIDSLVRTWIYQIMITEFRMQESAAKQVSGRIFATGSYRYNVHTSGSDIDIVLIAPARITRDHFFNSLAPRFKMESWVTELHCIRDTRVPIIAMVCDGIDIDLSFGAIRQDCVPEVITDDLLLGLDEQSVLSCNAVRVAQDIIHSVPDNTVFAFRQTLRFVKAWGKQRGIYSNTFGFPSGIGWAILVAFVSQCYPNQNPAGLVTRFYRTYNTWFKPNPRETGTENRAIYLTPSMRAKTSLGKCWDPRETKSDAMALFPVLTPALPYGNACYNVTATNLKQLCAEFRRGQEITTQYLSLSPEAAQAMFGPYGIWSKLLEPAKFFGEYAHYMHIRIACHDPEQYQAYVDGVESKIRILWAGNASSRGHTLEDIPQLKLRLNPKRYEDPEEVERRTQWLKRKAAANAGSGSAGGSAGIGGSLPGSGRPSARESGTMSHRNSSLFGGVGPLPPPPQQQAAAASTPAPSPLTGFTSTAHYFIGMEVDAGMSRLDLRSSIVTFHDVIRQLRQFKVGITELPAITVCGTKDIPQFVLDMAGYKPPAETVKTEDTAATSASATAGGASAGDTPTPVAAAADAEASKHKIGAPAADSGKGSGPAGATGAAAASATPAPGQKRPRETPGLELDLDEALGLDF